MARGAPPSSFFTGYAPRIPRSPARCWLSPMQLTVDASNEMMHELVIEDEGQLSFI
jgi:hypothetical protein